MHPQVSETYLSQTRRLFHCQLKIKIPGHAGENLLDQGFALLEMIDQRYNSHQPGSFLDQINKKAGSFIPTDDALVYMIDQIKTIGHLTSGAFDITAMPLLRLYGWYSDHPEFPSETAIQDSLKRVGQNRIVCNGTQIRIDNDQEIGSGSFLKSFALDRLLDWFAAIGLTDALVNAGGSTIRSLPGSETDWTVRLPHPFDPEVKILEVPLGNRAFSLSAGSDILDARTGKPSKNLQAGVLADDGFTADLISTALFACGAEDFEQVSRRLKTQFDFEAYLFTPDASLKTTGYEPFEHLRL